MDFPILDAVLVTPASLMWIQQSCCHLWLLSPDHSIQSLNTPLLSTYYVPQRWIRQLLSSAMSHLAQEMDKRRIKQSLIGEEPLTKPQVIREYFHDGPCAVWGKMSGRWPSRWKVRHAEGQRTSMFKGKEVWERIFRMTPAECGCGALKG